MIKKDLPCRNLTAYLPNFFSSRYLNGGYLTLANAIDNHVPISPAFPPIFRAIGL